MKNIYSILDCFVDEPACFGVPPFLSPYVRYVYGALLDAGVTPDNINYITIDTIRENNYKITEYYDMVFLIGGAIVPGKYLGQKIGTLNEIKRITGWNNKSMFAIGGLISHLINDNDNKNIIPVKGDIEKFAYEYAKGNINYETRTYNELSRWAVSGACVVREHPGYPDIICEIETYRGCPRKIHCSFCSESITSKLEFRDEDDIINEIDELIKNGISRFRLGRQADILEYKTKFNEFRGGFPKPEIDPIRALLSCLRERRNRGEIKTLNIDNANPGTIYNFPEESSIILESIVETITPGDTLALGIESFDPNVIQKNNLKVNRKELIDVVRIINQIGGKKRDGIPILLPGINLIHGLIGENQNTFKMNYEALLEIKELGLLLKRINIRKILPFPGTDVYESFKGIPGNIRNRYEYYKGKIRNEIDKFMLKQIYPVGTIIREMLVEELRFDYSYAKQIASYSITAKLPLPLDKKCFIDAIIIAQRERSVIALPYPVPINMLPQKAIELLPGVNKNDAMRIILQRPFSKLEDVNCIIPRCDKKILDAIII